MVPSSTSGSRRSRESLQLLSKAWKTWQGEEVFAKNGKSFLGFGGMTFALDELPVEF